MKEAIHKKLVPNCLDEDCNGLVKPEIVFFGEQLPAEFFHNRDLPAEADLCIVMGSSLSVHPFASLPQLCQDRTPRVLINREEVGDFGSRADDVMLLEDCDTGVRKLAEACGWLEELEALWATTARADEPEAPPPVKKSRDEQLLDEVEKLTKEVEETLSLGKSQHEWLENHVDKKIARKQEEDLDDQDLGRSNLEPASDPSSKTLAPVAASAKTESGNGLSHVFPFLKKSAL